MKPTLLTIVVFLFLSYPVFSQVRGTTWGESKAEVKNKEKGEFIYEEDNSLGYTTIISALDVQMHYSFTNKKLSGITYLVTEDYMNTNQYIYDYDNLKNQLTKKYGEPTQDKVTWLDEQLKGMPDRYGFAIGSGQLKYMTVWMLDNMMISLALMGENYKCNLAIMYRSTEYAEPISEVDPGL